MMRGLIIVVLTLSLLACSQPDPRYLIPTQMWNDVVVEVQVMPTPVRPGMNEFLVLTTLERGKPVQNLLVSLRSDVNDEWRQAVQDGLSGVHRRSLYLSGTPVVYVQLRKKRSDESVVLEFPIVYEADVLKNAETGFR